MADFPTVIDYNRSVISILTSESIGNELTAVGASSGASAAWPAANLALYVPFRVGHPMLIAQVFWAVGTSGTDSVDFGVYDAQQNKIFSTGTTLTSGSGAVQSVDITDVTLSPGLYYLAMAVNGTTNTFTSYGTGMTAPIARAMGCYEQTTAFNLPTTATFTGSTRTVVPFMGLTNKTVI